MPRVLILCTGNSCRSQMAEAIWNRLGRANWQAFSAGSSPAGYVHPLAIQAMQEIGLPTQNLHSKAAADFTNQDFELVITVCGSAKESCPNWPRAASILHWPFDDPAHAEGSDDEKLAVFRRVRDEIQTKVSQFLEEEGS